jgi:hypothetical protein
MVKFSYVFRNHMSGNFYCPQLFKRLKKHQSYLHNRSCVFVTEVAYRGQASIRPGKCGKDFRIEGANFKNR